MKHEGDSEIFGFARYHWDIIWPLPASELGAGIIGHEKLYPMKGDREPDVSLPPNKCNNQPSLANT